jgi:hypothetical protein
VSRLSAGVLRNEPLAGSFFFSCQLVPGVVFCYLQLVSLRFTTLRAYLSSGPSVASRENLYSAAYGRRTEDEIRSVEGLRCYARNRFVDAGGAARDGSHCLFGEIRVSLASNQALLSGLSQ